MFGNCQQREEEVRWTHHRLRVAVDLFPSCLQPQNQRASHQIVHQLQTGLFDAARIDFGDLNQPRSAREALHCAANAERSQPKTLHNSGQGLQLTVNDEKARRPSIRDYFLLPARRPAGLAARRNRPIEEGYLFNRQKGQGQCWVSFVCCLRA